MNSDVGRRAFVRNMVIGLPVLAGAASVSVVAHETPLGPGPLLSGATPDSHIDLVLRQMAGLTNDIQRRGVTVEDARTAASYLRTLALYRQEAGRDAEISLAFRELIAEQGLRNVATIEPNLAHIRGALTHYGIDARRFDLGSPTYEARVAALETLAREGASPTYIDGSTILDEAAASGKSLCEYLNEMMSLMEAMAAIFCVAGIIIPPLEAECLAASMVLALLKTINLIAQC